VALVAVLAARAQAPPGPLRSGPMLGYAEMTEVALWLQTQAPARAQVRYWPQGRPELARLSPEAQTAPETDLIARFKLGPLDLGSRYDYEVYLDGARLPLPYAATFQSQPMWRWRGDPPPLRAAIGSCLYVNDPPFDRPGKPYGGGYQILSAIAAARPDFMIWMGDNVYYREADWTHEASMRRRYAHTRALPELQPLLAAVHHYAIWDDHDFGANDSDRAFRGREASLRVFRDYWANPGYGTPETPGVFTRFEWSDVEFFLLDDRYHRSANAAPPGPQKRMFGTQQLAWLTDALAGSPATFKVIVAGNQMINPLKRGESFARYPEEQAELLDALRTARVEGVVFLSGDRHYSELLRIQPVGLYPLYEFTSSPLTAGTDRDPLAADNPARVPGTWVADGRRSFGLLEVGGPPAERTLTLRALDASGVEIWRHSIRASELRFAAESLLRLPASAPEVGVVALDLDRGAVLARLRGDEPFQMGSVYKLPIALALLARVDRGELSLADAVTVAPEELAPGHSPLRDGAGGRSFSLSVGRLLDAMLSDSDNTASDVLLRLAGGPPAVTARLVALGIQGVRVDRSERQIAADVAAGGVAAFHRDPRDSATPDGFAALLAKLHRREDGLSPASHRLLLETLSASRNPRRIAAGLPAAATVAHKTGTMPGVVNDVALVTSPDGRRHLALVVFTRGGVGNPGDADREALIADLARQAYARLEP
jgi:alkaline phosphatase D